MPDPITRLNTALDGRYRIERELGEGGMATVYLADDLRHERKVALKVLRPELAAVVGAERFLAEIKTTANLQHPHILPLFDSGEAEGFLFYVMPYIEGETLRERIDREKQLPVDEALGIATAVANALQTAHDAGVVHRDIKPGNILLSRGEPLVADFGIALAIGAAGGNRLTETGLSVGTPYYMSPEQATGDQMVGPAADTYALACVLYEMLVGEPPYLGNTAQAVLGKIIQGIPVSATSVRSAVPPNVDAAIRRALEKLPADRFTGARDFARALADPAFRYGEVAETAVTAGGRLWRRLAIGSTASALALAGVLVALLLRPEAPLPVTRVAIDFPEGEEPALRRTFDISADGSLIVYRGPGGEGTGQLWARRLDALEATPIRDTDGGGALFAVSPDGQEVAIVGGATLRVVPVQGGIARTVASEASNLGARWSLDGAWLYFRDGDLGVSRVPAAGGPVEVVTRVDTEAEDAAHNWVEALPGGRAVVYTAVEPGNQNPRIQAVDVASGEVTELTAGRFPRYSQGYLLFTDLEGTTLMAQPFDVNALELTGPAVPVAEGLATPTAGWAYYAVSQTGSLLYATGAGGGGGVDTELLWLSRSGTETPVGWSFANGGGNEAWRLSPEGDAVALRAATDGNLDIWVKELPDRPPRRLTFAGGEELAPWWTPDGLAVNYIADGDVWVAAADGTGEPTLFLDAERAIRHGDWSPDGAHLVLRMAAASAGGSGQADRDLYLYRPGVDEAPTPLVAIEEFAENNPAVSPDGRWLAYASTETGRYEVWVRPFPDVGSAEVQVSANGGTQPRWGRGGDELFYLSVNRELVSVRYEAASDFRVVGSETLFTLSPELVYNAAGDDYDVAPDDERFLMARDLAGSTTGGGDHVLVVNIFEELRRRTGRN